MLSWGERNQCAGCSSYGLPCTCFHSVCSSDPGNNRNVKGRCRKSGRLLSTKCGSSSCMHILSVWYLRLRFVLWHMSSHWQMAIKALYIWCYDCSPGVGSKVTSWCSTHPLEVPSDAELIEELSFLLSQSLTSRLRIYAKSKTCLGLRITFQKYKHSCGLFVFKIYKGDRHQRLKDQKIKPFLNCKTIWALKILNDTKPNNKKHLNKI